ncbi:MAG TPA: ATP-dependent zinc metalloprotease FtsH [Sandaracinaceae bacterium LLY-WYZ-13_1]|nr:ATP-dependent zinc metalloprotease FtsH [Sandaracinaceae bacterium LLY-WYZ-13_1]
MIAFGLAQVFLTRPSAERIRYDQFERYIREERVDWVKVGAQEIRGAFHEDQIPAREEAGREGQRAKHFVTGRVGDDAEDLRALLREHHVAYAAEPTSPWSESWPTLLYIGMTVLLMIFLWRTMFRRMAGGAGGVLSFGKSKGKVIQESDVDVTFGDVAGADEAKQELQEIIEFLQRPEKFRRIGAKIPKGVLLVGPPGTGKTLMARAVAGEAGVPFISISGSEFVEMFVGVGAARVRDLFEQANKSAPCIVFIDELDALGRSRSGAQMMGGNEERESTLNQLLVEMDGFDPHDAVIIMAATNRPEVLDPALLRPGRFDRQVLVDRPDRKGREAILRVHVKGVKLADDVDLETLAKRTPGFAGADLANLVNEAALLAARRDAEAVTMRDFSSAIDRVVAGLEKKNRLMEDSERERIAYHEVGHALCSVLSGSDERVHKISIVPRGVAALGYTMQLPDQEKYLMTEPEIRVRLRGLLGGRAAEEVVFGEPSTGAQNDLQKATEIARAMVTEYGMSQRLGPVHLSRERRPVFLGDRPGLGGGAEHGEQVADAIDEEVREIVRNALEESKALLQRNRDSLETITRRLLEQEQLEGDELEQLLADARAALPDGTGGEDGSDPATQAAE